MVPAFLMSFNPSPNTSSMTQKQMSLSRLARLALSAASASPPSDRAEACRIVAIALSDECPDLAALAAATAAKFHAAAESEISLIQKLDL
jgi:hypothetical protein